VTVSVIDPAGARVFVGGSVNKPGAYPIDSTRGALEAIVLAGGFDRESRADEVVLIRRSPNNKPMLRTVDLRGFISNGFATGDVPLYAGDIIYVPRNRISEIDLWMEQFITKFVPFNRSFDYSITRGTGSAVVF
jgi:protein involved in polysaccharide export with SLBB domain